MKTRKIQFNIFCALSVVLLLAASLAFSQGLVHSGPGKPYDPKERPPASLPDAYAAVMAWLGAATNKVHCVSATCLKETLYSAGWTFTFSNTNGELARVEYYFGLNYVKIPDAKSIALLKADKP